MDRNALDWLFSTAPQTIAALVGFIFAGVSFIFTKIDDRVYKDESITEIAEEVKKRIHKNLKWLLWIAAIGMVIDVVCLFINRQVEDYRISLSGEFSWYFTISIVLLIGNITIIVYAIWYVIEILHPDYFENTRTSMEKYFKSGSVKISDFIAKYIAFESVLRLIEINLPNRNQGHMTIYQLAREAYNREYINKDEMGEILAITKIRNYVIHGGEIQGIEPNIIKQLERITAKLEDNLIKNPERM